MVDLVQLNTPKLGWNRGGVTQEDRNLQYLRNGARKDQGYYYGLVGSHIRAFDWYQNQRPWMTLNGLSRDCPEFLHTRYYLSNGQSYGLQIWHVGYIHTPHPNKGHYTVTLGRKDSVGESRWLPNFFQL